jgi:hypothetical protein
LDFLCDFCELPLLLSLHSPVEAGIAFSRFCFGFEAIGKAWLIFFHHRNRRGFSHDQVVLFGIDG